MTSILVVCTGNICRSPIAEGFLRSTLSRRFGAQAPVVSSAGTAGWEGSAAMDDAVRAATEREIDITGHVAQKLAGSMVIDADLVVCMAGEHRSAILRADPVAESKVFTLKELVRVLDALAPAEGTDPQALPARVAQANARRTSGFAGNPLDEDVADPMGQPLEAYRAIAWELDTWCGRLADGLFGTVQVSTGIVGAGD